MFPIYALWCHPRSMSTATERLMRERGDLDCAHEPFIYDYYVHRKAGHTPHFDVQDDQPVCYADIRDALLQRAQKAPVFFKDMSYYVMPHILEDAEFCARLTNVFLIRDPRAAITSYVKLDPQLSLEEVGIEAQWHHYAALRASGGDAPVVLRAEDIRNDPQQVIGALWDRIGLPPAPQAFDWTEKTPDDWQQVEGWHQDASTSRGIRPMEPDHAQKARAKFDAAASAAPHLRQMLAHHEPFYDRLSACALRV